MEKEQEKENNSKEQENTEKNKKTKKNSILKFFEENDLSILKYRKIIQLFTYYLIPLFLFLTVLYYNYIQKDTYELIVEYGGISFKLILLILFIKPISVIFNKILIFKRLLLLRRELGVLSFWFGLFHGIAIMIYLDLIRFSLFIPEDLLYFTGFLTLVGMLVLGLTSNNFSVRFLKSKWKKVQMLVYPTFFFLCIHKAEAEAEFGPYVILIIYTLLKIYEFRINKINKNAKTGI